MALKHRIRDPKHTFVGLVAIVVGVTMLGFMLSASRASTIPATGVSLGLKWSEYDERTTQVVIDKLSSAGAKWLRVDIDWVSLEDTGADVINATYDHKLKYLLDRAAEKNISVLGTVYGTPAWANGGSAKAYPPDDLSQYSRVMGDLAHRYRDRVAAWQIWSQPNNEKFWAGKDPARYVALLKESYSKIKAVSSEILVVYGGPRYNDSKWIEQTYQAGAISYFDIMDTNPFMGQADNPPEQSEGLKAATLSGIETVIDTMRRYGDEKKPIWFSQFGWSSRSGGNSSLASEQGVSELVQADYLTRAYKHIGANFPDVAAAFWYTDRDGLDRLSHDDNFGLLRNDLTEKPAYSALVSLHKTAEVKVSNDSNKQTFKVQATAVSGDIIAVSWNKVSKSVMQSYQLSYRSDANKAWTTLDPTTSTSQTITGLDPSTRYQIELRTATGPRQSTIFFISTKPRSLVKPVVAPTNLAVKDGQIINQPAEVMNLTKQLKTDWLRGRYYFELSWQNSGVKAKAYALYTSIGDTPPNTSGQPYDELDTNMRSYKYYSQVPRIIPGRRYNFTLVATNPDGSPGVAVTTSAKLNCLAVFACQLDSQVK